MKDLRFSLILIDIVLYFCRVGNTVDFFHSLTFYLLKTCLGERSTMPLNHNLVCIV